MHLLTNHATIVRRLMLGCLALVVCLLFVGDALACPTCKDGMAGQDPLSQARASGYFYSILFMMSMPFLIIGTFGSAAYLSIRRARAEQAASQD